MSSSGRRVWPTKLLIVAAKSRALFFVGMLTDGVEAMVCIA
jgi:hypothetical protein